MSQNSKKNTFQKMSKKIIINHFYIKRPNNVNIFHEKNINKSEIFISYINNTLRNVIFFSNLTFYNNSVITLETYYQKRNAFSCSNKRFLSNSYFFFYLSLLHFLRRLIKPQILSPAAM